MTQVARITIGLSARRDPFAALDNGRTIGTQGGSWMAGDGAQTVQGLRLAELLAAVSLGTVLAVEFARLMGWDRAEVSDVYYLALLYHIGCTGAVDAQSRLGVGDDVTVRRWMSEADYANRPEVMRIAVSRLARQWGPSGWAQGIAALATAGRDLPQAFANIAEVACRLSQRLGG